jgi:hypothetical protein
MSDLPRHAVTRSARLARLPAGYAGRTALGTGKRIGGRPAELVNREIQQRTADQVFTVLGELKGCATKLGQALSPRAMQAAPGSWPAARAAGMCSDDSRHASPWAARLYHDAIARGKDHPPRRPHSRPALGAL